MRHRPLFAIVILLVGAPLASAQEAPRVDLSVQYSRDGAATIIQKDFGPERWSILHRIQDGFVSGNVFYKDGRPPSFLSCDRIATDDDEATYRCFDATGCRPGGDDDGCRHDEVGEVVLPTSFFLPEANRDLLGVPMRALLGEWTLGIFEEPFFRQRVTFTELAEDGDDIVVGGVTEDGIPISVRQRPGRRMRFAILRGPDACWSLEFVQLAAHGIAGNAVRGDTPSSCFAEDGAPRLEAATFNANKLRELGPDE